MMKLITLVFGMVVIAVQPPQKTEQTPAWKTFTNRAGWSIQYPTNWTIGSCHSCSDPAAENVFVTFFDPHRATDYLMIEHLISKPADKSDSQWLQEMSKNPNARTSEEALLIDGMPALRVRYKHPTGREFEMIYVVRDSDTFEITISEDKAGERIQDMSIYPIYQHMLSTFKFTH
jgi:hypothetical protein